MQGRGDSERSCKTRKGVREARPDGLSGLKARRDGLWALRDSNPRPLPCKDRIRQAEGPALTGPFGVSRGSWGARGGQKKRT